MDTEDGFDPTLLKKKTFDLDAAHGLDDGNKKEELKEEETADAAVADLYDDLDLENFGKKKRKKKKKPFNLDELEGALPSTEESYEAAYTAAMEETDDINLDMAKKKKKKPKKKKVAEFETN